MTESLCKVCKYNMPRYSATSEGAVESRCELNGAQSGTYGNVTASTRTDPISDVIATNSLKLNNSVGNMSVFYNVVGIQIRISGSVSNDGKYNITSASWDGTNTIINIDQATLDDTDDSGNVGSSTKYVTCDKFDRAIVSIPSDRYPHRKKGTSVDTHVDQIDPKIDVNDPYALEPTYKRKKYKERWR